MKQLDRKKHLLLVASHQRGTGKFVALVFLCALVVVPLALPAGTWARDFDARKQPGTSAEFTVVGTNGYSLDVKSEKGAVTVVAADRRLPVVTISALGDIRPANKGTVAASTYITRDSSRDPNVIEADLAPLGKISVAFQPSGETRVTKVDLKDKSKKCVGAERIVRRLGTFTGTIKFQGENGYTTVDLPSAEGTVGTSLFRNCTTKINRRGGGAQTSSSGEPVFLTAMNGSATIFAASTCGIYLRSAFACFFITSPELLSKDLLVVRSAKAVGGKSSFIFDDALTSATLAPPAPFSGHGSFSKGPKGSSSSWTGSLSVAVPGVTVPLAGPSFRAKFFRLEDPPD